jgi:diguanylate cyclase (GGDEF)-like protein
MYPFVGESARRIIYAVFAWGVVIPVFLGFRRRPPGGLRLPWLFLLGAMVLGAVSNTFMRIPIDRPQWLTDVAMTMPSLSSLLLLAATLGVVIRRGRNDLGGLIDAALVALACGGLLWNLVVLPRIPATGQGSLAQARLAVILMLLAAILGALLRLQETDPGRNPAIRLLLAALALNLTGFVLIGMSAQGSAGRVAAMTAFMVAYVALGFAAAGRSIHRLAEPGPAHPDRLDIPRLVFLGAALSVIPVTIAIRSFFGHPISGPFLIVATALVVPLVMVRIGLLTRDLHRSERALRHLAGHDPLTAAMNRRAFTAELGTQLDRSRDLALIFCDLDSFKLVNDRYGHVVGDRVLADVADRLRACLRDSDVVCRYGGDEFLILLRDAGATELRLVQTRIVDALAPAFLLGGEEIRLSASIGAIVAPAEHRWALSAEQLISRADAAMYDHKRRSADGVRPLAPVQVD